MAIVSMTTVDGYGLNISSESILMVIDETSSRKVFWDNKGIDAEVHSVTDDYGPGAGSIVDEAGNIVTVTVDGSGVGLNANRVVAVAAEGTGSKVFYSDKGFGLSEFITDEDPATIEGLIDAL